MSGNMSSVTEMGLEKFKQTCSEYLDNILRTWGLIYGPNDAGLVNRLSTLADDHEEFWKEQVEEIERSKDSKLKTIESYGKQALNIEKALGLKSGLVDIEEIPLVNLEEQLWDLLQSYKCLSEKRLQEFTQLQEKENNLCTVLGETCQLTEIQAAFPNNIISNDDMTIAQERVARLENLKVALENDFYAAKEELCQLLNQCEFVPLSIAERFACYNIEFDCTKHNYDLMSVQVQKYRNIKHSAELRCNDLKEQISKLWTKMLKDQHELDIFFNDNEGFKTSTIVKLENKLKSLQTERREKLKELIIQQRSLLDELWMQCKFTDVERNEFQPYHSNCFTENILEEHENQVDILKEYFNKHKRIFELSEKYLELWNKLLHLEDLAKRSDRLFKNRGGQLLKEEKERKTVQRQLPVIKEELVRLLHVYKNVEGKDFVYLGSSLLATLEDMDQNLQASKENAKLQRKAVAEGNQMDCRVAARTPTAGCKRKILVHQSQNVSTKLLKVSSTSSTISLASSQGRHKVQMVSERRPEHTFAVPVTSSNPAPSTPFNGAHQDSL